MADGHFISGLIWIYDYFMLENFTIANINKKLIDSHSFFGFSTTVNSFILELF